MTFFPRVFLNSREEKEINQGFPWVFDNEISHIKTKPSAYFVRFTGGFFLALGAHCRAFITKVSNLLASKFFVSLDATI